MPFPFFPSINPLTVTMVERNYVKQCPIVLIVNVLVEDEKKKNKVLVFVINKSSDRTSNWRPSGGGFLKTNGEVGVSAPIENQFTGVSCYLA